MKLSLLCPSRENSSFLSHFVSNFLFTRTRSDVELLVMMDERDTWNRGFVACTEQKVRYFKDGSGKGRWGLNEYYNKLLAETSADWVMLVCDDFEFILDKWDEYLISGLEADHKWDPSRVYACCPRVRIIGSVCHVISRGYINAIGGVLSHHWAVDSWMNQVLEKLPPDRIWNTPVEVFDDYSHCKCMSGVYTPAPQPTSWLHEDKDALVKLQEQADTLRSRL